MNVLKDKQKLNYPYLSRYASFDIYYNTNDNKYLYGITSNINKNIGYVSHKVKQKDTLDSLAEYYYGRPDLYWVIADFNDIQDSFITLYNNFKNLNIPILSNITFKQ